MNQNGTILYIAEFGNNRVQAFHLLSKMGITIPTSTNSILGVYFHDYSSKLYTSNFNTPRKLARWPSGQTLPANGVMACDATGGWASSPYGIIGDQQGNIHVSGVNCHTLMKWPFNSNVSIRIAGVGTTGSSSNHLNQPRHVYLDEVNAFIYVADTLNHRVQRFSDHGNTTGTTVAGGNGAGNRLNQTNAPTGVYVSSKDGSIYVSERDNHRVTKWAPNATVGILVAGNLNGIAGNNATSLNQPFAVILDRNETWIYVVDYNNHRVQRFPIV
jgi:DNA-binding beta-propeller fold protein YncE